MYLVVRILSVGARYYYVLLQDNNLLVNRIKSSKIYHLSKPKHDFNHHSSPCKQYWSLNLLITILHALSRMQASLSCIAPSRLINTRTQSQTRDTSKTMISVQPIMLRNKPSLVKGYLPSSPSNRKHRLCNLSMPWYHL